MSWVLWEELNGIDYVVFTIRSQITSQPGENGVSVLRGLRLIEQNPSMILLITIKITASTVSLQLTSRRSNYVPRERWSFGPGIRKRVGGTVTGIIL